VTALTMPQVKLEMDLTGTGPGTAPTYTDYSTSLRLSDGVTFTRGRQDERSAVTAGTAAFTLNNDAATFTRKPLRAPVRLSARFDDTASYTVMWTGYVTGWERGWTNGVRPSMRVTAADAVMLLEKMTLPSLVRGEILADGPVAYWPLDDAAGVTLGTDRTGVSGAPSLTVTQVGTGGTAEFGAAALSTTVTETTLDLTPTDASNGKYLVPTSGGLWPTGTAKTYECWFRTGTDSRTVLSIEDDYGNQVWVTVRSGGGTCRVEWNQITAPGGSAQSGSSAAVTDNAWHHVAYVETYSAGTVTGVLYVDGVDVGTDLSFTYTGWDSSAKNIAVGASLNVSTTTNGSAGAAFDGMVAHVAVHASALSSTRVAAHYAALDGGVRSDERFDAIGAISDVTVATPSNGAATMGGQPTAGVSVWSALTDVAFAEQGTAYIAADGTPTLAVRTTRYGATPAITLNGKDVDTGTQFTLDDAYVANDVTVSRPGGATARRRNTTSQAAYGTKSDTFEAFHDTDAQAEYLAEWLANSRGEPGERVGSLTIDATSKASNIPNATLATIDVGDQVLLEPTTYTSTYSSTYESDPAGFGTQYLVVEGMADRFDLTGWRRTLNVSPDFLSTVWLLDDVTYSVLDTTTVLGF